MLTHHETRGGLEDEIRRSVVHIVAFSFILRRAMFRLTSLTMTEDNEGVNALEGAWHRILTQLLEKKPSASRAFP